MRTRTESPEIHAALDAAIEYELERIQGPTPNGDNGRAAGGRFAAGNKGGPGNPHAKKVAELRAELFATVTRDDLRAIVAELVKRAKAGDLAAAKELFDRLLGKSTQAILFEEVPQAADHGDDSARLQAINDQIQASFLDHAKAFLRDALVNGPLDVSDLERKAWRAGVDPESLAKAQRDLGVIANDSHGPNSGN